MGERLAMPSDRSPASGEKMGERIVGLPIIAIAAAVAQGTAHILTKPWPWVFLGFWFAASKFDFGIFAQEARDTIWSLWWIVALIIIGLIVNSSLKVQISERGKTQRYQIKKSKSKNEQT